MTTKKRILLISFVVTMLLTAAFSWITINRLAMTYNEQGVYFDEEEATTYDSQAMIVYGIATAILWLATTVLLMKIRKAQNH